MNNTRRGKIARLPKAVREELNRRLDNGQPGKQVVAWLNALPEVQAVLRDEFGGRVINDQNLTDWKQGGYCDWVVQQAAMELAVRLEENAVAWQAEGRPPLTDTLALWLAARYAVATRQVAQAEGEAGWRQLRELCADVVELRWGDHCAERLRLERERLEMQHKDDDGQREARLRAMLDLHPDQPLPRKPGKPEPPANTQSGAAGTPGPNAHLPGGCNQGKSSLIKLNQPERDPCKPDDPNSP